MMRAVLLSAPAENSGATAVVEVDEPQPGLGEVAIDVEYAGVNFMDVMARRGDAGYAPAWPYVPGLEVVGTVRATGEDVESWQVGERVAAFTAGGGLAEVVLAPEAIVVSVPPDVPSAVAAAAPLMLSTAVLLVREVARMRPGQSILMHSASGGVGSAVAQVAKALGGGLLLGTVGRADKVAAGREAGWDEVVVRGDGLEDAVRRAAPGGVDIILDPTGTSNVDLDLAVAGPGARVILFGNAAGGVPAPLPPLGRLIAGNVGLIGFSISRWRAVAPGMVAGALRSGLEMIADGKIKIAVNNVESLDSVGDIHDLLATGRSTGKYVVKVSG